MSHARPTRDRTPTPRMSQAAAKPDPERRRNAALRELIDELLFRMRVANQHMEFWTPEERAKAEQELSTIMSRVRGAALQDHVNANPAQSAKR